jgi:ferric enterobactin receptor
MHHCSTRFNFLLVVLFFNAPFLSAQKGLIKGKIMDAQTSTPLSYAGIRVFKTADSSLIAGAITDDKGLFSITTPVGQFYAILDFIGYKAVKTAAQKTPQGIRKAVCFIDLGANKDVFNGK